MNLNILITFVLFDIHYNKSCSTINSWEEDLVSLVKMIHSCEIKNPIIANDTISILYNFNSAS